MPTKKVKHTPVQLTASAKKKLPQVKAARKAGSLGNVRVRKTNQQSRLSSIMGSIKKSRGK